MNALYFYLFLLVHPYLAMWWKSFEQADRKQWEALVPGYNYFVVFKIGAQKPWWSLLMVFPGIHLVMWSVANVSYIRRFGYFSLIDTVQGIFFPYIIMAKIANSGDMMLPETNWANSKEVGDREWGDHLALFLALPVLGHVIALGFAAVTRPKPGKRTKVKEWGDSIIFALVAASIIRTYVFEPYKIPTGSMEKTLLVGDFLFVNKLAYGPKVPVTPLSYPLVHNTVPWVDIKSYTGLESLKYTRLPGFTSVNRYDVVVFNFPAGDTAVYDPRMPSGLMGHNYHQVIIDEACRQWEEQHEKIISKLKSDIAIKLNKQYSNLDLNDFKTQVYIHEKAVEKVWNAYGEDFFKNKSKWMAKARYTISEEKIAFDNQLGKYIDHHGTIYRPVDKRENYIKRCVGTPGDWLEIKNSVLYVNGKPANVSPTQNLLYKVYNFDIGNISLDSRYGLEHERSDYYPNKIILIEDTLYHGYEMHLTQTEKKKMQKDYPNAIFDLDVEAQYSDSDSIEPTWYRMRKNMKLYPNDPYINNTVSNFRKFQIPQKGQTIKINKDNIAWYRRIITAYEGHTLLEKENGEILIDGKKANTYTFAMNYYWMMGDNRYNSLDSRMWGFVPEDHIVGKASMVWFSNSPYKGIRWDRLFSVIK